MSAQHTKYKKYCYWCNYNDVTPTKVAQSYRNVNGAFLRFFPEMYGILGFLERFDDSKANGMNIFVHKMIRPLQKKRGYRTNDPDSDSDKL